MLGHLFSTVLKHIACHFQLLGLIAIKETSNP
jgi:hypothetical protein